MPDATLGEDLPSGSAGMRVLLSRVSVLRQALELLSPCDQGPQPRTRMCECQEPRAKDQTERSLRSGARTRLSVPSVSAFRWRFPGTSNPGPRMITIGAPSLFG